MLNPNESGRSHPQNARLLPVQLPRVNFVGAVIDGRYRVQRLKLQGDHLDVYSVTDVRHGNYPLEAQAFPLSCPMGKVLKSRMRRMKRIYRSSNFQRVFNLDGQKFLISHVVRSEAEWRNLVAENDARGDHGESDGGDNFPALPSVSNSCVSSLAKRNAGHCSLTRVQIPHREGSLHPSSPGHTAPAPGRLNYAEVAARGQRLETQSSTPKGIRQRRRRQRRSQEKRSSVCV